MLVGQDENDDKENDEDDDEDRSGGEREDAESSRRSRLRKHSGGTISITPPLSKISNEAQHLVSYRGIIAGQYDPCNDCFLNVDDSVVKSVFFTGSGDLVDDIRRSG